MTFIRKIENINTMPAGMLRVIQVETEHFKRVSVDQCGHFVAISYALWGVSCKECPGKLLINR